MCEHRTAQCVAGHVSMPRRCGDRTGPLDLRDDETSTGCCFALTSMCAVVGSTGSLLLDSGSDEHLCNLKFADLIPTSRDRSLLKLKDVQQNDLVISGQKTMLVGPTGGKHAIRDGLIPGGQILSKRPTVFFLPVNPTNKEHKDPETVDLKAPRLARYLHIKTRCIGSISALLKRKDLSSIRRDRTPSSFTIHAQPIVSRRLSR